MECLIVARHYQSSRSTVNGHFDITSLIELSPTFDDDIMGSYFIHQGRVVDLHIEVTDREILA